MNPERPDNPENPDEGPEPEAAEELGAAGADVTETDGADGADAADGADEAAGTADSEAATAPTAPSATVPATEAAAATGASDGGDRGEAVGGDGGDHGGGAEVVAGGGAARPGRRRSRVVVASVAAAVLVVGGGGALLASTSSGGSGGAGGGSGSPGGDGTPPPLALDGYTGGGSNGIAPGEPDPHGVTYRADGELPDGPGSAAVHTVRGDVTATEVARLAKALGIEGAPTAEGETWQVGAAGDGSGPVLRVNKQAPGSWTFNRYTPGTDNCQKVDVCTSGTAEGGDPVSEAVARKAAAPVLKAVGQDDAKLDAGQLMGAVRVVNADPEVGGLPTYGWSTGIQVGADGQVVGGSGNLKSPVKSDTYPVVDAERALELMNGSGQGVGTARGGIGGCTGPVPLAEENGTAGTAGESGTAMDSGTVVADETPCERMTGSPERETITVEDAVFGLASQAVAGRPALVPSWMFEVRPTGGGDSYTVTHPAVDPAFLAAPEPRSEPTTPTERPGGPGDTPPTGPSSHEVDVQGYTVDGDELTVSFWGGVCSDYSASVSEKSGEVKVTVTDIPWEGKVCIMIAKVVERTVTLDEPLGDRKVVGSDGKAIPEGGIAELKPR
ncbi:hypothetical protein PV755_13575 [Streptomyces caniscabiei]|uniref:Large membrane protein n=1 Tax=Streptomyces caniscabiei TaxID=2746961 RepID=A0A927LCE3_9ACTN|nr:hypothetical protein [Streptomyces caniscabiei]MBD9729787.1 hypothetical protein [Streptomyces caniscabiei]MDX3509948.1 hypothetical protein [Streptomyces caniscabiei]MDX3724719.1 hypothetical protein [Streptomyces caniscabiei]WEO27576.1 hypothetical protein IHE65_32975 [Streptomyces caniscabiei]